MDKSKAKKMYELANKLSKVDTSKLNEQQLSEHTAMIKKLQEFAQQGVAEGLGNKKVTIQGLKNWIAKAQAEGYEVEEVMKGEMWRAVNPKTGGLKGTFHTTGTPGRGSLWGSGPDGTPADSGTLVIKQGVAEATGDKKFDAMMGSIKTSTPVPVSGYVAVTYASENKSNQIKGVTYNGKPMPTSIDDPEELTGRIEFTPDRIEQHLIEIGQDNGWDVIDPGHGRGFSELFFDTNANYTSNTQSLLAKNIVNTVTQINNFFNNMNNDLQSIGLPGYKVEVWQEIASSNGQKIGDLNQIKKIAVSKIVQAPNDAGEQIGKVILRELPKWEADDELGYTPEDFEWARKVAKIYITKGERAGLKAQSYTRARMSHVSNMIDELLGDAGATKLRTIRDLDEQGVAEGYTGRETKDGTWRVFKDGKAVAVAGPFKSREEAAAWIKKQKQGVAEGGWDGTSGWEKRNPLGSDRLPQDSTSRADRMQAQDDELKQSHIEHVLKKYPKLKRSDLESKSLPELIRMLREGSKGIDEAPQDAPRPHYNVQKLGGALDIDPRMLRVAITRGLQGQATRTDMSVLARSFLNMISNSDDKDIQYIANLIKTGNPTAVPQESTAAIAERNAFVSAMRSVKKGEKFKVGGQEYTKTTTHGDDAVTEEIDRKAYDRLKKVFDFSNFKGDV